MQHRYVPDLGDFSKFAVIQALSGGGDERAALVWYLADPEELGEVHRNDGRHTGYLSDDRHGFSACSPALYAAFQAVARTGEKHVGVYERLGVARNIVYADEPLSYHGLPVAERCVYRAGWLDRALASCGGAALVVLDPDNGLAPHGLSAARRQALKHATLDECAAFFADGRRTLVVYQHSHRQGTVHAQVDRALARLADALGRPRQQAFALRFHRGTSRCYLVLPADDRADRVRSRAVSLVSGPWGQRGHFSLIA